MYQRESIFIHSILFVLLAGKNKLLLIARGTATQLLIKIMGGKCEYGLLVDKGFNFRYPPNPGIEIGQNVYFGNYSCLGVTLKGLLKIGNNTAFTGHVFISVAERVEIGNNTSIGEFVSIRDGDHFYETSKLIKDQPMNTAPIIIEDDVWIGRGVAILKGSHIGKGAIIGANAVVKSHIPPYAIAVGIPAKVIKYRNPTPKE